MESSQKKQRMRRNDDSDSSRSSSSGSNDSTDYNKKKKGKARRRKTSKDSSESSDSDDDEKKKHGKKAGKKATMQDRTLELLTKRIEELTAQRTQGPSRGEKWCLNCRMSNHSTEECRQCDFCAARGHLWENYNVRLGLLMGKGQDVRMVLGTTETSGQIGGYASAAEELDAVPGEGEEQVEAPGSTLVSHAKRKATLLLIARIRQCQKKCQTSTSLAPLLQ